MTDRKLKINFDKLTFDHLANENVSCEKSYPTKSNFEVYQGLSKAKF